MNHLSPLTARRIMNNARRMPICFGCNNNQSMMWKVLHDDTEAIEIALCVPCGVATENHKQLAKQALDTLRIYGQ